ncbi:hypothetical protein GQ53DRAFT_816476 [Thozetella sp. PMI_491]|nr:hypothetical protein GQ53DRAFT_816476 [Thozetella sp. PMI_491]
MAGEKETRPLFKGRLKPPQPKPNPTLYAQPRGKNETYTVKEGKTLDGPPSEQVSLTRVSLPFIEPPDAFARPKEPQS